MIRTAIALALATCFASQALAQKETLKVNPNSGETEAQFAARTKWWREAKFGMFIHWGIYSVPGEHEWHLNNHRMQVKDYEKFAPQFNPTLFDAAKWVRVAKAAGMKYITITSKHHDGFCMFDSKLTDYNIVKATPYGKDPIKALAAECRKQGIKLCFYHSIMDWHHPDYLPRREWEKDTRPAEGADLDRYVEYMKGQLTELLTNYGPIWGIWFDGGWEHSTQELHSLEVVKLVRKLQPKAMINDRINIPEDYSTPEQTIPAGAMAGGRLWETCMTLNDHWGFSRNDSNWKSAEDLVHKVCDIAGKGGNFLLNVGPDELGQIPEASIQRLETVGEWMKVNGKGIYGTTKSPFKMLPFDGRCTQKGNTLYFHLFSAPRNGRIPIPPMTAKVVSAKFVSTGEKLMIDGDALVWGRTKPDPYATTVEVKLSGDPQPIVTVFYADPDYGGGFFLKAESADVAGEAQLETIDGVQSIGFWTNASDSVSWGIDVPKDGKFTVEAEVACVDEAAGSEVDFGGATLTVPGTGDWHSFKQVAFDGVLDLKAGKQKIALKAKKVKNGAVMNVRWVKLKPAG